MTVLSNIITPSNVLTTTNTATVTNKTLTSPTVAGMTVSDGTANGVTYLNGSKVLTSGSGLVFDGTNLGVGLTAPSARLHVRGSSSTYTGGIVAQDSTSNFFTFYANGNNGVIGTAGTISFASFDGSSQRMLLDTSGNLGLGVTPSASVTIKGLQVGNAMFAGVNGGSYATANAYFDGSVWKYITSNFATLYQQSSSGGTGKHVWSTAASGTAGNTITFTEAMTLDASGNLGVGTTSPSGILHVNGVQDGVAYKNATFSYSASYYLEINEQAIRSFNNPLIFGTGTSGTERARIDSSGNLLVGKTAVGDATAGAQISANGRGGFVRSSGDPLYVNRLTDDGTLVTFDQATVTEGSISVSGTTVSYNGGHLSRWAQTTTAKDNSLLKGTVLSNLDEMNVYTDAEGNPVDNEQLNKVKVSETEGDVNVAGVFVNWSHDDAHNVDEINMAMTGDMIIRIAQGVTVVRGDLLMSAGDGTAKPQGDDIIRSKTVAKVTSNHVTCTYADGSYCVPCVLMAC